MKKKLLYLHVPGYAAVAALVYWWLSLSDSSLHGLAFSALLALVIAFCALWLFGSALAAPDPFPLRRMPALLAWAGLLTALLLAALRAGGLIYAVSPVFRASLWIVTLAAGFAILAMASRTARGLPARTGLGTLRSWRYWVVCAGLLLCGAIVPWLLLRWVPALGGFAAQLVSAVIRLSLAYLLFTGAWLAFGILVRRWAEPPSAPTP
jgi:hypothetical protein